MLNPLGVRVTGVRRHPEHEERPPWMGARDAVLPASRLDEVLPDADHVILVLPILVIYLFASKEIVKAFIYSGIK